MEEYGGEGRRISRGGVLLGRSISREEKGGVGKSISREE
jgi:hypothetical protein